MAGLSKISTRHDTQTRAQRLKQKRHQIRDDQYPEQPVPESRATFYIRSPIARVHVADADQVGGSAKGQKALPKPGVFDIHALVDFWERVAPMVKRAILKHKTSLQYGIGAPS